MISSTMSMTSTIRRCRRTRRSTRRLHALPGRKLIFTNGTVAHAEKVLARIGITHHFGDIFDIVHSDFIPKPEMEPYRKFVAQTGIEPETSAMFEDIARNLEAPHALGMTTVLVVSPDNRDAEHLNSTTGGTAQEHIHHITDDLAGFLEQPCRKPPCVVVSQQIIVLHQDSRRKQDDAMTDLQATIEQAWEARDKVNLETKGAVREAVNAALDLLDSGKARVAEKRDGDWHVNQWLKKAVLLSFRLNDMALISGGPGGSSWWDKVPSKFDGWTEKEFRAAVSAPCRTASSASRPISRRAPSSCRRSSTSAPMSTPAPWSIPG